MSSQARVWYQTKPSSDRLGNAPWRHGKLQPLAESKPRWWPFNRKD